MSRGILVRMRMKRNGQFAWRQSVERSILGNGGSAGCQFSPGSGNRYGDGTAGRRQACSQRAIPATRLVSIRHRAFEPRCSCRDDDPFIPCSCASQGSGQTGEGLLCAGDDACGDRNRNRTRGTVHLAVCWHERLAGENSHHEIQGLDANCIGALVGCAFVGIGNLLSLVRLAFISEMKSRCLEKIEIFNSVTVNTGLILALRE
jgi:hypothetical protein